MVPLIFVGLWVFTALFLLIVALSGGARGAREHFLHTQSPGGKRASTIILTLVYLAFGVAAPALVIAASKDNDEAGKAAVKLNASEKRGRELFGRTCNECHTLAAANTSGRTGPNFDDLRPPKSLILNAIKQGRAQGNGRMPAELLGGQDAQDVANFITKVAGRD
jgi:mono/diheme cytochrome c family protein